MKTVQVNEETLKDYENQYHDYHQRHPNLARTWVEAEEVELMLPLEKMEVDAKEFDHSIIHDPATVTYETIQPRFAQVEALERLEATYEEGHGRAMVVMATGLGKTYLAAFFARRFPKVLFIAHREEILRQAKRSFKRVISNKTFGIYDRNEKEKDADIIFASIFTLSMKKHLKAFSKDAFDLIIIDDSITLRRVLTSGCLTISSQNFCLALPQLQIEMTTKTYMRFVAEMSPAKLILLKRFSVDGLPHSITMGYMTIRIIPRSNGSATAMMRQSCFKRS